MRKISKQNRLDNNPKDKSHAVLLRTKIHTNRAKMPGHSSKEKPDTRQINIFVICLKNELKTVLDAQSS